jgi:hypothetical protein
MSMNNPQPVDVDVSTSDKTSRQVGQKITPADKVRQIATTPDADTSPSLTPGVTQPSIPEIAAVQASADDNLSTKLHDWIENWKTPGGLLLLFLGLTAFIWAIVPVNGMTRLQWAYQIVLGKVTLQPTVSDTTLPSGTGDITSQTGTVGSPPNNIPSVSTSTINNSGGESIAPSIDWNYVGGLFNE